MEKLWRCVARSRRLAALGSAGLLFAGLCVTPAAVKADAGLALDIVKRSDTAGFKVLPKRWIVERTFGWLGRCRRLAKDFENLTRTQAAFVIVAMIRLMVRRISRVRQTT